MNTGMLWFDDSKTTLGNKITKAIAYYKNKYGLTPNLCLVNPKMLENQQLDIEGLNIRPYRPVLPGHIWIGVEDKQEPQS